MSAIVTLDTVGSEVGSEFVMCLQPLLAAVSLPECQTLGAAYRTARPYRVPHVVREVRDSDPAGTEEPAWHAPSRFRLRSRPLQQSGTNASLPSHYCRGRGSIGYGSSAGGKR